MVEPERIPSMRDQPERWVPESTGAEDPAPFEEPFEEPPFEPMPLAEAEPVAPQPTPAAAAEAAPAAPDAPPAQAPEAAPEPAAPQVAYAVTVKELFARMDSGWSSFKAAAAAWPSERMDEHIEEDGWSRKQMLAHIAAWHDATHDRLGKMILSGQPEEGAPDEDAFNARIARQAIGRTAGEILKEMEMTYNRLRRQVSRLTDQQLKADDGWASQVVAANTYEHYAEHAGDVYQPPVDPNARRR
jgi:hypothetical protein